MAGSVNIREIVFDMLMTLEKEHVPSHILLNQTLIKYQYLDKRDRAMLSRLFRGTLEYQIFLDGVLLQFIKTDWRKVKRPVRILLRLGSYQILKMDSVRDATACDEMVKLAKRRGLKNLSGFINGVLRNVSANKEKIVYPNKETEKAAYLSMRYALPEWLVKQWLLDYDFDTVAGMGEAMLSNQATTVRMRFQKNGHHLVQMRDDTFEKTREILIHELEAADIQVDEGYIFKDALRISGYDYLGKLNAFKEGRLTVQDEGSMLAAVVSGAKKGDRIIDVCAAPGGKSMQLADMLEGSGQVIAGDLTENKVLKIQENLQRTGIDNVSVKVWDARAFYGEYEKQADIVMADLPCSGLGVMGRKADIKSSMTEDKIRELVKLQREILSNVWRYVKPEGVLIYSTCTVSKAENEENVTWFTEHFPFERDNMDPYIPKKVQNAQTADGYRQILPGEFGCDGFFVARLVRKKEEA